MTQKLRSFSTSDFPMLMWRQRCKALETATNFKGWGLVSFLPKTKTDTDMYKHQVSLLPVFLSLSSLSLLSLSLFHAHLLLSLSLSPLFHAHLLSLPPSLSPLFHAHAHVHSSRVGKRILGVQEHGKRLALWYLTRYGGHDSYGKMVCSPPSRIWGRNRARQIRLALPIS